jgi:hypothetical protein
MEIDMKENLKKAMQKEEVLIIIKMEKNTLEIIKKIKGMGMEFIFILMEINI